MSPAVNLRVVLAGYIAPQFIPENGTPYMSPTSTTEETLYDIQNTEHARNTNQFQDSLQLTGADADKADVDANSDAATSSASSSSFSSANDKGKSKVAAAEDEDNAIDGSDGGEKRQVYVEA
ncbi:hypothetical protein BGW39_002405 [Mortierella sp. 14UC]|nr:hypothetical protein BGW39_002405 [Mortierella sp. 14UC]